MVCREQNRLASALAPFPGTLMENKVRIHSGEVYAPTKPRLPLAACFDGLPGIATSDTRLTCRVSPLEASSLQQASYRDPPVAAGDRPPPMCLAITSVCSHATAMGAKCGLFPTSRYPVSPCEPCWLFDTEWKITS